MCLSGQYAIPVEAIALPSRQRCDACADCIAIAVAAAQADAYEAAALVVEAELESCSDPLVARYATVIAGRIRGLKEEQ